MFYLYESSIGFFLFKKQKTNTPNLQTSELQKQVADFQKFKPMMAFHGSLLFQGHNVALETVEQLKNGELPANLEDFVASNLGKLKKKALAVQDKTLAGLIMKKLKIKVLFWVLRLIIFF